MPLMQKLLTRKAYGELILIDGGMCCYHLRRDKQLTISEIVSTRKGAGSEMLEMLKKVKGAKSIFAKCPVNVMDRMFAREYEKGNAWYKKKGFTLEEVEVRPVKKGRKRGFFSNEEIGPKINHWRLKL